MSDLSKLSDAELMALMQQQMQATPAPADDSALRGFGLGVAKPIQNAASALMQVPGIAALDRLGQRMGFPSTANANANIDAERAANTRTGYQTAGNIAGTLPTAAIPGGALVQGAAGGALLSDGDNFEDVAVDALGGAMGAKGVQVGLSSVSKALAPKLSASVKQLVDAGIPLTPGQASNGFVRSLEEMAMSVPGVRTVIEGARDRGTEQFNRTIIDRALSHLGEKLPKDVGVGRDAVQFLAAKTGAAYDRLMPKLQMKPDQIFLTALQKAEADAAALPGEGVKAFNNAVGSDVLGMLRQGTTLSGAGLKTLESRLSAQAATLRGSGDAYQKMAGETVLDLLGEVRNNLMRSNPAARQQLKAVNRAFAEQVRVERAAGSAGSPTGVFTAKQYQAALKAGDASSRKAAFSRGKAMNQKLADAAADVLPNRLPDSGTAIRSVPALLAASTGGVGAAGMFTTPLAAAALMSAPYTGVGQRAVNVMLRNPGARRRMIGGGFGYAGRTIPLGVPTLLAQDQ